MVETAEGHLALLLLLKLLLLLELLLLLLLLLMVKIVNHARLLRLQIPLNVALHSHMRACWHASNSNSSSHTHTHAHTTTEGSCIWG